MATINRVEVRKPDSMSSSEFGSILADDSHPSVEKFRKWLTREKVHMTVLGGTAIFTSDQLNSRNERREGIGGSEPRDVSTKSVAVETESTHYTYSNGNDPVKSTLVEIEAFLARASTAGASVAKFAAITSPVVGTFLLTFYLNRFSAPFPIGDGSISTLLVLSAFSFIVLFGSATATILYVEAFSFFVRQEFLREKFPQLRPESLDSQRPTSQLITKAAYQYATLYSPFIIALIFLCISELRAEGYSLPEQLLPGIQALIQTYHNVNIRTMRMLSYVGADGSRLAISLLYGALIGLPLASLMFTKFIRKEQLDYNALHLNDGINNIKFWFAMQFKFIPYSIIDSAISFGWIAISFASLVVFLPTHESVSIQFAAVLLLLLYIHFLGHIGTLAPWKSIALVAFMLVMSSLMYLGPSFFGAISLRMLGVGGGIPKTITVRKAGSGSGQAVFENIQGCLIIMSASQLTLYPTSNIKDCDLRSDLWSKTAIHPGTVSVKTFLRSDIWQVSGF